MALHDVEDAGDLDTWATTFESTHVVLADTEKAAYDLYVSGSGRPWYIVFDRDMTVIYKDRGSDGSDAAKEHVLSLLSR